jgi:very-short-patch-repair endonuclease
VKLAVELDGGQHNQFENREYDAARSEYLKTQGIDVLRFWNHEVLIDINSILNRIMEKIDHDNPSCPPLNLRGGEK